MKKKVIYYKLSEILEATEPFSRIQELEHYARTLEADKTQVPYEKITEVSSIAFFGAMSRVSVSPHMMLQATMRKFQKLGYQPIEKTIEKND